MSNLVDNELLEKIKSYPLGSQDGLGDDAVVIAKFYTMYGHSWLVTEAEVQEGGDILFFGFVELIFAEWGYFTLSQLQSVQIPIQNNDCEVIGHLSVERDVYTPLSTVGKLKRYDW